MDYTNIFRLVNLGVGALMIVGGIFQFFGDENLMQKIILGIYIITFGAAVCVLEAVPQVPPYLPKYASFLFSFLGRGVFYIFVGGLILNEYTVRIIAGTLVGIVGVGYCALEFTPQIEPPSNMRDAEAGWGAEQV